MVHVEDLVRAALHIYEYKPKEKVIGEGYNAICDCGFQDEYIEFLCDNLGVKYVRIPVWWPMYKGVAKLAFALTRIQENRARKKGVRPRFESSMAGYIHHQYYFSNQKLRDLGFKFLYPDFKDGTLQTIRWYKDMGWLEDDIDIK
jgi:nucleoside-diphosphate-sugar epimerase